MKEVSARQPDAKIKAARENWMVRLTTAGVPLTDFIEVTQSIDIWDDWCSAWSIRAAMHEKTGRECLARSQNLAAGMHLNTAALEYHFAKFLFTHDVQQMKQAHMKAVECRSLALAHMNPPGERVAIPFEGKFLYGNLRKPKDAVGQLPVILIISGMDSTKEEQHNYEQLFLERNMATFSFDGPGQGEGEYDWPIRHAFEEPVAAVINWVERRLDLDGDRIGVSGSSMGGQYAPRAAAFEKRIKAVIANGGAFSVIDNFDQRPQTLKDAYKLRTHSKSVEEAREKSRLFDLTDVAKLVTCPIFVIAGQADHITRWEDSAQLAKEVSGPSIFLLLEGGIHVGHNRGHLWRTQCADWMAEQLGVPKR